MTFLIRFILISIIIFLLVRSIARYFEEKNIPRDQEREKGNETKSKGVSKEVGEYIDYEEVD